MSLRSKWMEKGSVDFDMLDEGIRPLVVTLLAVGLTTTSSCEGGEGHMFEHPTVILAATPEDMVEVHALALKTLLAKGYHGFQIEDVRAYQSSAKPWVQGCHVRVTIWAATNKETE